MADPFIGEIRMVTYTYVPAGWAACDGAVLTVAQNSVLHAVLGTRFGGTTGVNFKLPNLLGRTPVGTGQGPGLSAYTLGQSGGAESVTVTTNQLPVHTHAAMAHSARGTKTTPQNGTWAVAVSGRAETSMYGPATGGTSMLNPLIGYTGWGAPHMNTSPYLTVRFVIALVGEFATSPD